VICGACYRDRKVPISPLRPTISGVFRSAGTYKNGTLSPWGLDKVGVGPIGTLKNPGWDPFRRSWAPYFSHAPKKRSISSTCGLDFLDCCLRLLLCGMADFEGGCRRTRLSAMSDGPLQLSGIRISLWQDRVNAGWQGGEFRVGVSPSNVEGATLDGPYTEVSGEPLKTILAHFPSSLSPYAALDWTFTGGRVR